MMATTQKVIETRKLTAEIAAKALAVHQNISEAEVRDKILQEMKRETSIYANGWYDPPPGGVSVLFSQKPFLRLQFETLRDPAFFADDNSKFEKESVGIIYISSVNRDTQLLGDIGFTIYGGDEEPIQKHIKDVYQTVWSAANHAETGMKFSDLYKQALKIFEQNNKQIGWMTTQHDPMKINLGHTVPGSFKGDLIQEEQFEKIREAIRTKRIYINEVEEFVIPATCAFTFEARLVDTSEPDLPNVFVHIIVTFSEGKKEILTNFEPIFKTVGMEYML